MSANERYFESAPDLSQGDAAGNNGNQTPAGADLLAELVTFIRRFIICSDAEADVVALFVVHTHAVDAAETTPYLAVTSPEMGCGKSRLFDVLELLVARPWKVTTPSEAVTFRKIEADRPTLLLDEVDAIFGPKANGNHEGLRALLNAGNRRGTLVPRCVGPSLTLKNFAVFCPKAIAGIGELPDTIADRALPVRMKRKAPNEKAEKFRVRDVEPEAARLRDRVADWAEPNLDYLAGLRPHLPEELSDRAQDAVEPLVAIADAAGGEWPARARHGVVELRNGRERADESAGVRLLADIRAVYEGRDDDRLPSADLAQALAEIEEAPWGDLRGRPLDARGLARRLRRYEIRPKNIRVDEKQAKGYERADFEDAWARYLPTQPSHPSQRLNHAGLSPLSYPSQDPSGTDTKSAANPYEQRDGTVGTARTPNTDDLDGYLDYVAAVHHNGHLTTAEAMELRGLAERGIR